VPRLFGHRAVPWRRSPRTGLPDAGGERDLLPLLLQGQAVRRLVHREGPDVPSASGLRVLRPFGVAAMAMLATACLHNHTNAVVEAHADEMDSITAQATAKFVMPMCNWAQAGEIIPVESAPAFHRSAGDGPHVRQACGMISREIGRPAFVSAFVRDVCGGDDDRSCADRFYEMFIARMRERYAFAKWDDVSNKCAAYPVECKTWQNIELWAIGSHNEGVATWAKSSFADANERYEVEFENAYAAEQAERHRLGAALRAFSEGMASANRPAVTCTSNTIGITTTTHCR
jgi:hypothetical protein